MNNGAKSIYEYHNVNRRGDGFSILKAERSALFARAIGTGKKILDLGCRDGALTKCFLEGNDVTGADIDTVALAKAQATLNIKTVSVDLNGDWDELGSEKYDCIVLAETLEHVYHPEKIVEKVTLRLNEDGMFVGSVPNGFSLKNRVRLFLGKKRYTTLMDPTHINHFTHHELSGLLRKHFNEVSVVPLGRWAWLDVVWPGMFSFDLAWICSRPKA
jgi:2-polyprenyl-3-methyl-5-hydroxy-6-metoxy-1,4-benzoquinol methylase